MKKKTDNTTMLILKKEFMGLTMVRNNHQIGQMIFNTLTVPHEYYENFYNLGFEFMFDVVNKEEKKVVKVKISEK